MPLANIKCACEIYSRQGEVNEQTDTTFANELVAFSDHQIGINRVSSVSGVEVRRPDCPPDASKLLGSIKVCVRSLFLLGLRQCNSGMSTLRFVQVSPNNELLGTRGSVSKYPAPPFSGGMSRDRGLQHYLGGRVGTTTRF